MPRQQDLQARRDALDAELQRAIDEGSTLLNAPPRTEWELPSAHDRYQTWHEHNYALLQRLFGSAEAHAYYRFVIPPLERPSRRSFWLDHAEVLDRELRERLRRLHSLQHRLDLLPQPESLRRTRWRRLPRNPKITVALITTGGGILIALLTWLRSAHDAADVSSVSSVSRGPHVVSAEGEPEPSPINSPNRATASLEAMPDVRVEQQYTAYIELLIGRPAQNAELRKDLDALIADGQGFSISWSDPDLLKATRVSVSLFGPQSQVAATVQRMREVWPDNEQLPSGRITMRVP